MTDDKLRDQVAKAVCSIAIGSERVETVMEIIQEHAAEQVQRAEAAEAAIGRVRYVIDSHLHREAGGITWVEIPVAALRRALSYDTAEVVDQAHQQRHQREGGGA